MKRVYVVNWTFNYGGGFNWFYEKKPADDFYEKEKKDIESQPGDAGAVHRFEFEVTTYETATDEIDRHLWDDCDETEESPFTLEDIDMHFNEDEYLRLQTMISTASTLFGDGGGGDLGINVEYERGVAEFICRMTGTPNDYVDAVIHAIHDEAKR